MSDSVWACEFWCQLCIFVQEVVLGHQHQLPWLKVVRLGVFVEVLFGFVGRVFVVCLSHTASPLQSLHLFLGRAVP